jgi:uncharacterized protein
MNRHELAIDPKAYGVPSLEEMAAFRLWDAHCHGLNQIDDVLFYADRFGIEHLVCLEAFGAGDEVRAGTVAPELEARHRALLEKHRGRISGLIRIHEADPQAGLARMERLIRNGPCVGIWIGQGYSGMVPLDDPKLDPVMRLARELKAVVNCHSWIKVGGSPRRIAGGNGENEATPMSVARLAARHPDIPITCGHAGGDWELAVRAIRPHRNVLLELAGSDPHAGKIAFAVRELGSERIVWGGHPPSRSWSTAISRVLDADLTHEERLDIFGRNLRRILAPIFRARNLPISI